MTWVKVELISGIDRYWFIEKGMIGGISYAAKRYSKENNKYIKSHDDGKPSRYIKYLDANNLYGWTMSQWLPCVWFK